MAVHRGCADSALHHHKPFLSVPLTLFPNSTLMPLAELLCVVLFPDGDTHTFHVNVSPSGSLPVPHLNVWSEVRSRMVVL